MEVKLPQISEGSDAVVITAWHVSEGARVEKDQDMLEVATDKATFDVPAPCSGVLKEIRKKKSEEVNKDETIAIIECQMTNDK